MGGDGVGGAEGDGELDGVGGGCRFGGEEVEAH